MWGMLRPEKDDIVEVLTVAECDALFEREAAVVFKHSPTCPESLYANRIVTRFRSEHPQVPVYRICVRRRRDVSRHLEQRTGIEHESPQVIILHRGEVVAFGSHEAVDTDLLNTALTLTEAKPI